MLGGILFLLGSLCYHPEISKIVNGDLTAWWLFIIGSVNFLLADIAEWTRIRFGGLAENDYGTDNIVSYKLKRAEFWINLLSSAIGNILYLLGFICFIPAINMSDEGEILFIVGSLIIFLSQLWKCVRIAITNKENNNRNSIWRNIYSDFSGFGIEFWAGIGALAYAIGCWGFEFMVTNEDLVRAVNYFIIGGSCFFLSGAFLQYKYYCTKTNCSLQDLELKKPSFWKNDKQYFI